VSLRPLVLKSTCRLILAFLLTVGLTASVSAEMRRAFVVGIDQYDQFSKELQLDNAVSDAEAVAKKLTEVGFDEVTIERNPDRYEFHVAWQAFLDSINSDDTVTFYYSGHGVAIDGKNYLLPRSMPDLKPGLSELIKSESLSLNNLLLDVEKRTPAVTLMILDACRNDPFMNGNLRAAGAAGGLAGSSEPPSGTFIMYSAAAGKVALDGVPGADHPHSVYTSHLLDLIPRTDLNIASMARELRKRVNQTTRDFADGFLQSPAYYDGLIGDYCLPGCESNTSVKSDPVSESSTENAEDLTDSKQRDSVEVVNDTQVAAIEPLDETTVGSSTLLPEVSKKDRRAASVLRKKAEKFFWNDLETALGAYRRSTVLDPTNEEGWSKLGHLHQRAQDHASAMQAYETVMQLAEARRDQKWRAIALYGMGTVHQTWGNINEAENFYNQALERELDPKRIADIKKSLGSVFMTRSNAEEAEPLFLEALTIYKKLKLDHQVAGQYGRLGTVYVQYGNLDKAEQHFQKALEIHKKLDSRGGAAWQYNNLAKVYQERGESEQSEQYYVKAMEAFEELDDQPAVAKQVGALGILYLTRGDLEQAEAAFLKARDIFELLGYSGEVAAQYSYIGHVYKERDELEEAERHQRKALALYKSIDRKGGMAEAYGDLGMISHERGQFDLTREYWDKGRTLYEELGNQKQANKFSTWIIEYL